jgi:hypothetical protein
VDVDFGLSDDGTDDAHGAAAAQALAAAWLGIALRALGPGADAQGGLAAAIRRSVALTDGKVRRTAATETAEAFNDERAGALVLLSESEETAERFSLGPGLSGRAPGPLPAAFPSNAPAAGQSGQNPDDGRGGPYRSAPPRATPPEPIERMVKTWSALLDRKVCADCRYMHGTTVLASDELPGGDPPRHPFCRCVFVVSMTTLSMSEFERAFELAA